MFGVSGAALSKIRHMQNGGKRPRHSVDQWDRQSTLHSLRKQGAIMLLTMLHSDGQRPPPHRLSSRTDGPGAGAGRL